MGFAIHVVTGCYDIGLIITSYLIAVLRWGFGSFFFNQGFIQFFLYALLFARIEKVTISVCIVWAIGLSRIVINFRRFALPTQILFIDNSMAVLDLNI